MSENTTQKQFYLSAERAAMGKERRNITPRAAHTSWQPPADRADPIVILEESNRGRVPELVPIRHGRMLANPFAFLRGSAAVMAYDLAHTPVSGIQVQACGDCHIANFGLFATPERNLIFDLNDFDETLPAPWEWDIKRLAASFVVAGRTNSISDAANEMVVHTLSSSYRRHLAEFAGMRVLDVWYAHIDEMTLIAKAPDEEALKNRQRIAAKAHESISEYLFPKISKLVDGHRRIVDKPPLIYHTNEQRDFSERMLKLLPDYMSSLPIHLHKLLDRYRFEDIAFKVVGVGSVGTRCAVILFLAEEDDALLLQVKEARASVLEPYAGKSPFDHHGQRIVVGQRLMQPASDMFLGWVTGMDGNHYYVRQLRDMKFSISLEDLAVKVLDRYAELCGWVLARAHAKSGDAAMLSGYLGRSDAFDQALGKFALDYADQTEKDHAALVRAVKSGRLQAIIES
jgi:uncharacterized protein (DUF2252 family)